MRAQPASSARTSRTRQPLAEPSHPALLATLTYTIATLMLAWPALGGGFLANVRSDQYIGGWPVRDFAGQALKAGQGIPEWNPYLFGGLPYIAAMHGDIFYPTALLRLLLPTDIGLTWGFVIHVFLAGCFTYGFLRAWGFAFFPALIAGIAYMMSGELAGLVSPGHDGKLVVSALMPLALWFLVRGVRDGRHWAWGGLAITVGLAVLSPHPQLLQYMLLTCGAFALYLAFRGRADRTGLARDVALKRLGLAALAVAVGMVIGAVQYLPVLEYVPFSPRAGGKGWEHAVSYSMPIEELINVYLPQFSGLIEQYWGRNLIHLHSEYLGAVALVLASAAFGGDERKGFRRFWLVVLVVSTLWALGGYTPFYHLVYAIVPGTKFFRAPSTMLMVVAFATAMLVALGTERALAGAISRRLLIGWLIAGGVVALLALSGGLTSLSKAIAAGYAGDQLDDRIDANRMAVALGSLRSLVFVAAAAALVVLAAANRLRAPVLGWGLAAILALDLWSVERHYWQFSPRASVIYASDPAIEYVKRAEPGRVLALQLGEEGAAFRDPFFGGDALMAHRIRLVRGYHGNEIGRYQRLASREQVGDYGNLVNPAFWRLTNARFLYTNAALSDSSVGVTKILGPVRNAAGSTVYLYRLPGDNPPAWVTTAMAKAGDEATAATVLDPRFDPLRVAVIDSAASVSVAPLSALPQPLGITTKVTRYDPGHISLDLSAPAPAGAALVVSENYYPGWTARVNDRDAAPVVRADYTFIGVPLPAGATRVSLDFHDPAYGTGKAVTFVAVLLALLGIAAGVVVDRRARVG
jgi:hypothetical protein